jgi:hypothetical protein
MTKPLSMIAAAAAFAVFAGMLAVGGCTIDGLDGISVGDDDGSAASDVESCVSECRDLAGRCGYGDTCEQACGMLDEFGCLEESHDLYQCKADGADICKAPQCMEEAQASLTCVHSYCDAHPEAEGC